MGRPLPLDEEARAVLVRMADGDGRSILTLAEDVWRAAGEGEVFDAKTLQEVVQRRAPVYDKAQDGHYNLISALHKSIRGSDPDAALYYFARMLDAGEDPLYLARRLIRMAAEDVGLADPQALVVCNAAREAFEMLGSPEGELALAEAVVYVATAPKSNALYTAFKAAKRAAKENGSLLPPKIILNAPTKLMKGEGYGDGYRYDHDEPDAFSGQDYFPEKMGRQTFYEPVERGFEREIRKRLDYWSAFAASAAAERKRGPDGPSSNRSTMCAGRPRPVLSARQTRAPDAARIWFVAALIDAVERAMLIMLAEIVATPSAATRMFSDISAVTADCSSTAEAIAEEMSLTFTMVSEMPSIAPTASRVDSCTEAIWAEISSVALAVCVARLFTSLATTANRARPRRPSPPRSSR